MLGKIVKGIAGFYYVYAQGQVYECKARGIFRKDHMKPLVGDDVEFVVPGGDKELGNITVILPRRSELVRPAAANVDQALVIFAVVKPNPDFGLLDRFLIRMEQQKLRSVLCFNKEDLASTEDLDAITSVYGGSGYPLVFTSAREKRGLEALRELLAGRITAVAGPSGVGKSSLINCLHPEAQMETGEISSKIERGRHTTRHSEIIALGEDTFIMDTPGFSTLAVEEIEKEELWRCYPEFLPWEQYCRFQGCSHIDEPDCGVKQALGEGKISPVRYDNYRNTYRELKERKRYP